MLFRSAIVGAPFLETTEEQWDFVHGVVLKSIFLVSKAVVPLMLGRPGANVVNVSSVGGIKALKYMSAYGAAKAGVLHLSKGMAIDLADEGIRVNALCPGVIDTQQPRQFVANLPDPEAAFAAFEPMHPIGGAHAFEALLDQFRIELVAWAGVWGCDEIRGPGGGGHFDHRQGILERFRSVVNAPQHVAVNIDQVLV